MKSPNEKTGPGKLHLGEGGKSPSSSQAFLPGRGGPSGRGTGRFRRSLPSLQDTRPEQEARTRKRSTVANILGSSSK